MPEFNKARGVIWEHWYLELEKLAGKHGVSVADEDAWMGPYEDGQTPEQALYEEYPEFKPADASPCAQHEKPCFECPWRRNSAPGWLGASEPGEFLAQADSGIRMPCHTAGIDYESPNWEEQAKTSAQCAGHAIFLANRCKLPAPGALKLPADHEAVFTRPHEFVAHHARMAPAQLEATMIFDLYRVTRAAKSNGSAKPSATKASKARKGTATA
ncbi:MULTISPECIES: hypothetical protein [unclassified Variovorax]|uniref:hypothetical protein n=1 Tax=unclassified Variovorax TaxID=663243 RepID=UPI0013181BDA|nr:MULTISPECIES: hypothetical protein [unclassified Variovorax]VTU42518.1 hypothetical protein H6P1_00211 [Variovorax sp. PBL-H6]VTU43874.1 hypothetical protein SRS16P1_00691 [Variovorax sp. SRS16]VTU43942.1 hypothetical protein E5P1_00684 [Variovorax sp. PBL-E5]